MGTKLWVLGVVGVVVGTRIYSVQNVQLGGASCFPSVIRSDFHNAASIVREWAHLHDGNLPERFDGIYFAGWELYYGYYLDSWQRAYHYEVSDDGEGYRIWTLGQDGVRGGAGLDTDKQLQFDPRVNKLRYFDWALVVGGPDQQSEMQWVKAEWM